MEVVLKSHVVNDLMQRDQCFNPCFDGSGSEISSFAASGTEYQSFNPCFDGSGSEILHVFIRQIKISVFQSLF